MIWVILNLYEKFQVSVVLIIAAINFFLFALVWRLTLNWYLWYFCQKVAEQKAHKGLSKVAEQSCKIFLFRLIRRNFDSKPGFPYYFIIIAQLALQCLQRILRPKQHETVIHSWFWEGDETSFSWSTSQKAWHSR